MTIRAFTFLLGFASIAPPILASDETADQTTAAHLRTLHQALTKYLAAHEGVWPQIPLKIEGAQEFDWWLKALSPYGVKEEHLLDPRDGSKRLPDRMSYAFTMFDEKPNTAFRWVTQPWIITVGPSLQSGEVQLLLPDGRVLLQSEFDQIVRKVKIGENKK